MTVSARTGFVPLPRRVMRMLAVVCLALACALIAAEWTGADLGFEPGALVSAGLVLCVPANLLSALLLLRPRA